MCITLWAKNSSYKRKEIKLLIKQAIVFSLCYIQNMNATLRVLKYMIDNNHDVINLLYGLKLTSIIYNEEIVKKYMYTAKGGLVINKMTYSFLGRLCAKNYLRRYYDQYGCYSGHAITTEGREYYNSCI